MESNPIICKDCIAYYKGQHESGATSHECHHPNNKAIDLVTGAERWGSTPRSLRDYQDKCGEEAKWFQPKEG